MKYKVNVQNMNIAFECDEGVSVLDAMIHNGKGPVKHGCCGGGCGICRGQIISGDFFAFKPMSVAHITEAERKQGMALLCCVQPRSDMLIAAG